MTPSAESIRDAATRRGLACTDGSRLPGGDALDPATPVLVSGIVDFTAEYRLHVLDGEVRGACRHAENGRLALAEADASARAALSPHDRAFARPDGGS
ncbi:ATP-grasp domain-containing protein [Phytomonospora sp. NPDC050363]|uniref:ATP-grasp domain-containing protein n=1 Tax=Phytomonospora sp. NPDC050363 TaxID=3155642 RepID=UPI0033DA51CC